MSGWLLGLGVGFVAALCAVAFGGRRGRFPAASWPTRRGAAEPAHRQAVHHFASGVLPPWR